MIEIDLYNAANDDHIATVQMPELPAPGDRISLIPPSDDDADHPVYIVCDKPATWNLYEHNGIAYSLVSLFVSVEV